MIDVKPGDEVFIVRHSYPRHKTKVSRVTKTLILVKSEWNPDVEIKFRRTDGRVPGVEYNFDRLAPYSKDLSDKYEKLKTLDKVKIAVSNGNLERLSLDDLNRVAEIIGVNG